MLTTFFANLSNFRQKLDIFAWCILSQIIINSNIYYHLSCIDIDLFVRKIVKNANFDYFSYSCYILPLKNTIWQQNIFGVLHTSFFVLTRFTSFLNWVRKNWGVLLFLAILGLPRAVGRSNYFENKAIFVILLLFDLKPNFLGVLQLFFEDTHLYNPYIFWKLNNFLNIITTIRIKIKIKLKFVSQHLSGAGSSGAGSGPAGSVGRDLNLQKLRYQYLTTSVAVGLVVRWWL